MFRWKLVGEKSEIMANYTVKTVEDPIKNTFESVRRHTVAKQKHYNQNVIQSTVTKLISNDGV